MNVKPGKYMLTILLLVASAAQADIYKWRDERGIMHYSDMPPPVGKSAEKLGSNKGEWPLTSSDAPKVSETAATPKASPAKQDAPPARNVQQQAVDAAKAMEDRLKAQNCANARTNYRNYAVGGRIQSVNESGDRTFMSDDEIHEGMSRAQQEIDANCPAQ